MKGEYRPQVTRTDHAMGYRALLKQYIRHLLKVAGDHHIHTAEPSSILSRRDVAELKLLAAEIDREDGTVRRTRAGDRAQDAEDASLAAGSPAAQPGRPSSVIE